MILEICANSVQSGLNAELGGADRIELCTNLEVGGITPSFEEIKSARAQINIPIHVLIRPRSGDFVYSELDQNIMFKSIKECFDLGIDGVVIGALNDRDQIDMSLMDKLCSASQGMNLTFHRAFDELTDHLYGLDQLKELGIHRVLTSGGRSSAFQGKSTLKKLVEHSEGVIEIMPGGGVRPDNLPALVAIGATEFHSSALIEGTDYSDLNMIKEMRKLLGQSSSPHNLSS